MDDATDQRHALLGPAWIGVPALTALVREASGRPLLVPTDWGVEPIDYTSGTPSTGLLVRVRGAASDGDGVVRWSFVIKQLQSLRYWPMLPQLAEELPPEVVEEQIRVFPWRAEADIYASDIGRRFPPGLRLPRVYRLDDLGDERVVLWMEDVQTVDARWDRARYERAGHLLGRLSALRSLAVPAGDGSEESGLTAFSRGMLAHVLPKLSDDATWRQPLLAATADDQLRTDLLRLGESVPAVLDLMDGLPHTLAHGDACPQNLLVPADGSADFVVIDWGAFNTLVPVGFDLGHLLIGRAHTGELDPAELPGLVEPISSAYADGLRAEGMYVGEHDVRTGFLGSLVVRSALTALPLELLDSEPSPELLELVGQRTRLTRFLVDQGLALLDAVGSPDPR